MWNLLKKSRDEECGELRDLLEESAAARLHAVRVEELSEDWPAAQRNHIAVCESCQEAAQDLFATRKIFRGVASETELGRPWFATRVMEAIRSRERQLALGASLCSALPRLASRLAWVALVVLLAGSAWLYERPASGLNKAPAGSSTPEYLFESPPPPIDQDDVLISMAEKNP